MNAELIVILVVAGALFGLPLWWKLYEILTRKQDKQPPSSPAKDPPGASANPSSRGPDKR